ncbi:hypothetical protein ACGFOU_28975 [Streptomyces sp. NPDC048595]|uniref:hypothetical protein n=1 Tax=Streptomyces sp. NPDC048595 TaxID=3365576 RepID=UPI0037243D1E
MADDRYNWLDKDAAEHLLRGEPVGARHGDGAHELEQLLQAAAAIGAKTSGTAPLPGEEAAVTAFRQAAGAGSRGRGAAGRTAVRGARATGAAERPWVVRPFRRGFVVALAACAIGGVAVAAGTGVLHSPFRGSDDPEPASTVSSAETPGPFDTREPGAQTDGTTERTPDPSSGGKTAGPDGDPTPGSSHGATPGPGKGTPGGHGRKPGDDGNGGSGNGGKKKLLLSLCRDYESGQNRQMDRETVQRLESKAGGPEKVHAFCRAYLDRYQSGGGSGDNDGLGGGSASGGDEDDDHHPSQSPVTTPAPGASTPASGYSSSVVQPRSATPTDTPSAAATS